MNNMKLSCPVEVLLMEKICKQNEKLLTSKAKINHHVIKEVFVQDEDLTTIHLIGSAVLNSKFHTVNFGNASLLSTKFSNANFEYCEFHDADICSVWAKNCKFVNANFSQVTFSDSTFINCIFDQCIFKGTSLTKCQFIDCIFDTFSNEDSTFTLNTFTSCKMNKASFDETFYYQIFDNCTFKSVEMDPYLLGFNFGFNPQVLEQLAKNADLQQLYCDLIAKGLYSNAAILRVNQVQGLYDEAILACILALGKMMQQDILVKADEIEFLKQLTAYLQKHKKIAPISILQIWQLLNKCIVDIAPNTSTEKALPYIQEFANQLYFDFINFESELQKKLEQLPYCAEKSDTVELKIMYNEKPLIPLLDLLQSFSMKADSDCPAPRFIRAEKGSYHEMYQIALIIIPYLQTFFTLLGVVVPIVIYKDQKKNSKASAMNADAKTDKKEIEIKINTVSEQNSPILLPTKNTSFPATDALIIDVTRALESHSNSSNIMAAGYNPQNVQTITIRFQ